MNDEERMAEIGRAVVRYCHPGDERAMREATPELVVQELKRTSDDLLRLQLGTELRAGTLLMELVRTLGIVPR